MRRGSWDSVAAVCIAAFLLCGRLGKGGKGVCAGVSTSASSLPYVISLHGPPHCSQ